MEIKYEAVFGQQELFDCASDDAVLAIKDTTSGRIHSFTNDGWVKSGLKHERHIGTNNNQIAMRRIIKTQVIGYDESEFEDELETLYWRFDTDKKTGARSERDIFKGKVRYLINKFTQPKKTPVWTVADQQAGRLPEVGCLVVSKTGKVSEVATIKNGYFVLFECGKSNGPLTMHGDLLMKQFKPIETPEEKAARLREEWCIKALSSCSILSEMQKYELKRLGGYIEDIYDALLSGKLAAPKGGE